MNARMGCFASDLRQAAVTARYFAVRLSIHVDVDGENQSIPPRVSGRLIRPLRDKLGCTMRTRRHIYPVARQLARPCQAGTTGP